ncbi:MAG: hypothetical protein ACLQME_12570 [Alphaproteobacteria bacterium]
MATDPLNPGDDFEDDGASFRVRRRRQLDALERRSAFSRRLPPVRRSTLILICLALAPAAGLVLLLAGLALVILAMWIYALIAGPP